MCLWLWWLLIVSICFVTCCFRGTAGLSFFDLGWLVSSVVAMVACLVLL